MIEYNTIQKTKEKENSLFIEWFAFHFEDTTIDYIYVFIYISD